MYLILSGGTNYAPYAYAFKPQQQSSSQQHE